MGLGHTLEDLFVHIKRSFIRAALVPMPWHSKYMTCSSCLYGVMLSLFLLPKILIICSLECIVDT